MSIAPRIDRVKNRRKRQAQRPTRLMLELMEDRTVPAQAIAVGPDLSLFNFGPNSGAQVGNSMYFLAHQSTDAAGVSEIWQVNGTATAQEVNVPALAGMSIDEIASVGSTLYVTANPPSNVPEIPTPPPDVNVWRIDPTAAGGAVELTSFQGSSASDLEAVGNKVVFENSISSGSAPTPSSSSLWVSDGTVAGTTEIYSFASGIEPNLASGVVAGSELYFQANALGSPSTTTLWVTDGTATGTQAVTGIGGPTSSISALNVAALGSTAVVTGVDGSQAELWTATNGAATLVQSFNNKTGDLSAPFITGMTAADGKVFFAINGDTQDQVWSSDGTGAGTTLVYQQPVVSPAFSPTPPPFPSTPYVADIAALNGSVYFTIIDGGGLLEADGQGGATPVPLPAGLTGPSFLDAVGNRLYFMADDGVHGTELWTTDGTAGGAVRLTDINPGSGSSFPIGPQEAGGALYVAASDGIPVGQTFFAPEQLWMLPDPAAPAGAVATIALTPSAPAVTTGSPVTLTAIVTAADPTQPAPTGEVVFRDDTQIYGSAPLVNGVATLAVTLSVPGADNLEAVYTGDSVFDESISAPVVVTAGPSGTTLGLTTSDATADPGQDVTFTATITPTLSAPQPPSGSVNFFDGTNFLGTGLVSGGVATYQTSTLTAGPHAITASYSGDSTFSPSTAAPLTEVVGPSYTLGLKASQTNPALGQPLTLTAQVTPTNGSSLAPGMSVIFRDAATPLGTATVNASGVATLTISNLGVGAHSLGAVVFNAATEFDSPAVAVTVHSAATTAVLHSTAPTAQLGQGVTLTFTISPLTTGIPAPTGVVTFKDGLTTLGTASLANGRAVLAVSNLALGNHSITATYQGDANYTGSSANLIQTVTAKNVTTTIAVQSSLATAIAGQQVALSAAVTPSVGTTTPTGSVTFFDGAVPLGSVKIDLTGHALLLTSSLATGNHTITASFGGSDIYAGSTSAPVTVAVRFGANVGISAAATTTVSGQNDTLTATVAAASGGALQPAGTATFYDGNTALGTATLQNGVAKLTTTSLTTVGIHRLTVVYGGNALFATTTSSAIYITVRAISTTTTIQSPAPPAAGSGMVTLTATVGIVAPGGGPVSGKVSFLDGNTTVGTANVINGTAAVQIGKVAAGSHYLRAVFTGTGAYAGSSSAVIRYTVAATTSTTLQATAAAFGQTTSLKAIVSVLSPGLGNANGTVTFKDGTTVLGSAVVLNGVATLGVRLTTGSHTLTATYAGNSEFTGSAAAAVHFTVTKATPALTLKSSSNPKSGAVITLTTLAGPATAGAIGPTGSILLTDGATIVGSGTIANGVMVIQTTKLTKGTHTLTATYAGDANYLAATAKLTLTVG